MLLGWFGWRQILFFGNEFLMVAVAGTSLVVLLLFVAIFSVILFAKIILGKKSGKTF